MKSVTRIVAAAAAVPIAGLITLGGASAAFAGCTNTVINGTTVCVPNSDGGVGGGGTGTVGNGGSTAPGDADTIVGGGGGYVPPAPAPAPYVPPVAAPAPAPIPAAPHPAPVQQAPSIQIPAPAHNYGQIPGAPTDSVAPPAVSDTPVGTVSPEIAKKDVAKASESDATVESKTDEKATEKATPAPDKTSKSLAVSSATPKPSVSASPTQDPSIDASRASENQGIAKIIPGLIIGAVVILTSLLAFFLIKMRQFHSSSTV